MPQKISIVIIGASHRDPAPIKLLIQQVLACCKQAIRVVVCNEHPCDRDFEQIRADATNKAAFQNTLKHPKLQALLKRDARHQQPYFSIMDRDTIAELLPEILSAEFSHAHTAPSLTPNLISRFAQLILNYLAINEASALTSVMHNHDIPYQGIDFPQFLDHAFANALHSGRSGRLFDNVENDRVGFMAGKVCKEAVAKLAGEDGLIICQVGYLHVQRLAASILRWRNKQPTDNEVDLEIFPMCCHSNYGEDAVAGFRRIIAQMGANDPSELQALYPTFAVPSIVINEYPNYYGFNSDGFDRVFQLALRHCAAQVGFSIDEFDPLADNDIGYKPSNRCCPCVLL